MKLKNLIFVFTVILSIANVNAQNIPIQKSSLVGDRIVEFIPDGFDQSKTPSLILTKEPIAIGAIPENWTLIPEFAVVDNKANASLKLTGEVSLYGGGEVTGPLLRNGQYIKLWNTDTGAYGVDGGKRLYQSHPWVMGVRTDGTAFGIIFDSTWKSELYTNSDEIKFNTEGALFRIYIIDRESPQAVLKGLAELTGTIKMPPLWSLGYHQCRFSYSPDSRVREIADTFRAKNLPCDVIWMDIDYMNGYRVFTFSPSAFPDPKALNDDLHKKGFRAVYMIDPGVKYQSGYSIYDSGTANDVWVKRPDGQTYQGKAWPGYCAFPDFTMPRAREWWANLYQNFLAKGIDGVWNDMNEPAVNDDDIPENQRTGTMPENTPHRGGDDLPSGSHLLYHNAYGRLMVEASFNGIMEANPDKRPFLLTRSNLLGGQRYAATWTGDNWAGLDHMKLSVPMSITLGLSGQPYNGADIGGFLNDTSGDLWANWLGFAVFMPFARGHACAGTNDKEPWAFGEAIEETSRMALERRYRLLPYLYTLFYDASQTGMPVMEPVFFANPKDLRLRNEQEAFLLGDNLLVVPAFASNPTLPSGIWEDLSLIDGDISDKYQAKLKVRGGSIIPTGKIIQNTTENSFDPLTLITCLDENGKAEGKLYMDAGDGWDFQNGDYGLLTFNAERNGNMVEIGLKGKEGKRNVEALLDKIDAQVLFEGKVYKGTGSLTNGIEVPLTNGIIVAPQLIATLEAENGVLTLPAKIKSVSGYSGGKYVGDNDSGSSIAFNNVNIPTEGIYEFKTYYTSMQLRSIAVKANNYTEIISTVVNTTSDWNTPPTTTMSTYIHLNQGMNVIKITPYPANEGGPNMDKFEIWQTSDGTELSNLSDPDELLKNMTVQERLTYIGGIDWMYTKSIPRLGITSAKMSDGPQGLGTWGASTAYPCALMLSSSWNRDLAYEYGKALATDCKARGVNILLGPAVNIYRAPMCGRNFEYMGEDPYLAAETSTEYIKGLQDNGVMGVIKHFAANFQEYDRNYVSSDIDERTLHEIYFPTFRSAVQKADVGAVMTSYNLLNGVWTTENPWLLKEVLRNQWDFKGMVMSDWGSTHNCIPAVTSGLDLEMAGNEIENEDALRTYLASGEISMDDIDLKVKHILSTLIKFGVFDHEQLDESIPLNNPASAKTALDVSRDGIVLLKNENNILPLNSKNTKNIAVIGNNALIMAAGGGSGLVSPFSYVSYFDGLKDLGEKKGFNVTLVDKYDHLPDVLFTDATHSVNGLKGEYFNNVNLSGSPVATRVDKRIGFEWTTGCGVPGVNKNNFSVRWTGILCPTISGTYTFRVSGDDGFRLIINGSTVINQYVEGALRERTYAMSLTAGNSYTIQLDYFQAGGGASIDLAWEKSGDNNRFKNELDKADVIVAFIGHNASSEGEGSDRSFELPSQVRALITEAQNSTKPIIAVMNAGGNVYMQDWISGVKGLIWGWYGGQEAGTAMAEVLLGDICPSGKLPVTFEKKWEDNPVYNSYYDTNKHVAFTEGVFVGYRGYDKMNRDVQYPFGYGLSYTTFQLSDMQTVNLSEGDNLVNVTFKIKNTGTMAGAEVVQLYVNKQGGSPVQRPLRELKDYRKIYLEPNEEKTMSITLSKDAFSYYSVADKSFVVDNGDYKIELGTSSRDIKLSTDVVINYASMNVEVVSAKKKNYLIPSIAKSGDKIKIGLGIAEKIMIYDLNGRAIEYYANTGIIETGNLHPGVYLVSYVVNTDFYNEKVVIQ